MISCYEEMELRRKNKGRSRLNGMGVYSTVGTSFSLGEELKEIELENRVEYSRFKFMGPR